MPYRTLAATLTVLMLCSLPAFAEQGEAEPKPDRFEAARSGLYLGMTGLMAFENGSTERKYLDDAAGLEIYGGVNFAKYFGAELYGDWIDDISNFSFGTILRARYPIDRWSPNLGIGAGVSWADRPDSRTSWGGVVIFTGGVDVYLTRKLVLDLEGGYRKGTGTNAGVNYVIAGIGLKWVF